jgi:hypothetical protein
MLKRAATQIFALTGAVVLAVGLAGNLGLTDKRLFYETRSTCSGK